MSTARPFSDTVRAGAPKRVRQTQTSHLGNLTGSLEAILDRIAEPALPVPPPSYAAISSNEGPKIPVADDVLTQAIHLLQSESNLSVEEQTVAIDMFIENTKSATAWLAMKPGPVWDFWLHNRIIARVSIQQGLH